jgi:hypothetical protein
MNDDDPTRVRFVIGDITEGAAVLSALRESHAQRVIHLAGLQVTFSGPPIPIAPAIADAAIKRTIGLLPSTPHTIGIRTTMKLFAELRDAGRLDTTDIS